MNLAKFLKNKGVVYAIIIAAFYQVAMVGLYIYGYHVLPGGATQVGISVVNQDGAQGAAIQKGLASHLKLFKKVIINQGLDESKKELNDRTTQMIIVIPPDFVNNLTSGKSEFDFYINESNPITTISAMTAVAKSITDNFNQTINRQKLTGILSSIHISTAQQELISEKMQNSVVQKNIIMNQAPQTMDYLGAPMFMSIATYAASMVIATILMNIFLAFIPHIGKWKSFFYIEVAGAVISLLAPLCGIIMARLLITISSQRLILLYLQQVFMQFASFQFVLIFPLLFGMYGIFFNMFLMFSQTICGGGTLSLDYMPDLFKAVSYITPMYPNTQIVRGLMYGGPISTYEYRILAVMVVSALILLTIVWSKWPKKECNSRPVSDKSSGKPVAE